MHADARIWVAGSETLLGAALLRQLVRLGHTDLCGGPGAEPDLTREAEVEAFFARNQPEYVFLAAGKSGGIAANLKYPADLMTDNLLVAGHVIQAAHWHRVRKLLYLASSCCYPRTCRQPMRVEDLFTGPVEPTSEPYAVAKLAGLKLCQAYRSQYGADFIVGIPANAFGPGDDFSPEDSHVVAALIRRMDEAKAEGKDSVAIWGTGTPRREFVYADDVADACLFVMRRYTGAAPINLGGGHDVSIRELALTVREIVGFRGELVFDASRPDGMPLKALDSGPLLELGWRPATPLREALAATYQWYRSQRRMTR